MNLEKIQFKVVRDFGETFNVSMRFLRQNFKVFFLSLLLIAGPFVLISGVCNAFYQSAALSINTLHRYNAMNPLSQFSHFGLAYIAFILSAAVANLMVMGVTYAVMLEYHEKGPRNFSVGDVGRRIRQSIGGILAVFFLFMLMIVLLCFLLGLVIVGVVAAVPALGILLIFLVVIGLLIIAPPYLWRISTTYLVKMETNDMPFDAYARTGVVMKNNFWWTWLIIVCASLMIGIAGFAFNLPQVIYTFVITMSNLRHGTAGEMSVGFLIVVTIGSFFSSLLYSVLYLISAFHYYSLDEKHDGAGLMERINEIGQTPQNKQPDVEQHY